MTQMTDANMAQREKIVKSMKKNFKDFRKRYGERAKDVMYATATKMAMKEDNPEWRRKLAKDRKDYWTPERLKAAQDNANSPEEKARRAKSYADNVAKNKRIQAEIEAAKKKRDAMKEAVSKEDEGEYDYEGDMAKSSLKTIIRNAQMMHDMLQDTTNLPEWVQSKITLAEDYMVSAAQYMQSEMNEALKKKPMSVVSTKKEIGHRIADIGPGGKEYNVKTNAAWDKAQKNTPKMTYKKMRSQERFDSRFKEVDNNYPYRSDN